MNPIPGRDVLPIPDHDYKGLVTFDARDPDTSFPPIEQVTPPEGAPNVLVVLIDDVGFGASSAFGGPIETPAAERLASTGLTYNRFHTTALCSPTRAALLTGRNHHSVGMGGITEIATSAPGNSSQRPNTAAPLAETLRLNGYSTAQFGKCHEVPVWETSPMGPFDHWPAHSGFEKFYGFIAGETNQWVPELYEGITPVELPDDPDYHLTEDLADKAVNWISSQRSLRPDHPFFCYFAPGATHAPHQVAAEWIEKYHGRFDAGWDALRAETFERQKELGVIPADAELTERPDLIPAWEDMPDDLKPVLIRQMETYAGFLEHTDHQIGVVLDALERLGLLENTLVFYIIGDNGASAEGTMHGTYNEMINFNGMAELESPEFLESKLESWGGYDSYGHYSVGWAHAMDTPYQWTKQVASHFGGTRNGTIVHWPKGIESSGEVRSQFCHVIDVAPTILEAAGLPHPTFVNGVQQQPIEGTSLLYSFDEADAPERHETQYFEMFGNRGIYHKGWTAVTKHKTPWEIVGGNLPALDDDVWELYDTNVDWSQARDLSKEMPDKLHELQRLWLIEAVKFNVLPIDDRSGERFNADAAGRPELVKGDNQTLFPGMVRLSEHALIDTKNKSHSITAQLTVPDRGAEGVIIAQGGNFGGWAVYALGGKFKYVYNLLGLEVTTIESPDVLPAGDVQVQMDFVYDGGGLGKGGAVSLYVDGNQIAEGRLDVTHATIFSADSTASVGEKGGAPISDDFSRTGKHTFNGRVHWVHIKVGDDSHDHYLDDEERYRIAMSLQ
ncbi:MAG: arylsulfatase [Acidimicrobiales bacterium]